MQWNLFVSRAIKGDILLRLAASHRLWNRSLCRLKILLLFATVSEHEDIRNASREVEKLAIEAEAESLVHHGIARLVAAVFAKWERGEEQLDDQAGHLLKRKHGEFLRNSLGITNDEDKKRYRDNVVELNGFLMAARKLCCLRMMAETGSWGINFLESQKMYCKAWNMVQIRVTGAMICYFVCFGKATSRRWCRSVRMLRVEGGFT